MHSTTVEGITITALGHSGFRLETSDQKLSWAHDPYDVSGVEPVDYIFVSHEHYDHCDPPSIRQLLKPKGKIIVPKVCETELREFAEHLEVVDDTQKHPLGDLKYWVVPAYNTNKFRTPAEVFHPQGQGGVGFIVELNNKRYYHAGDTDVIPEMENLKKITVAFLPISGTYVMTADEAIEAAEKIEPKLVIPMHYGKILGSVAEAIRFQNLLKDRIPVTIIGAIPD